MGRAASVVDAGVFEAERLFQVDLEVVLEDALAGAQGERRPAGHLVGERDGRVDEVAILDEAVEQADAVCLASFDGAAAENDVGGAGVADDTWEEKAGAGIGREASFHEGCFEAGGGGAEAQVAGEGEAEAAAGGDAVDGGEGGLVEVVEGHRHAPDPAEFIEAVVLRGIEPSSGRMPVRSVLEQKPRPAPVQTTARTESSSRASSQAERIPPAGSC